MSPLLSIIIVNHNGRGFLDACLESVIERAGAPHEVIVVDNASTDGSAHHVRGNYPRIRVIESGENLGFSGGNNRGAREAIGPLVLLLNNDTRLLTPLAPCIEEFERDKTLGALGCRMYFEDGSFQPSMGFEHRPVRVMLAWTGLHRFFSSMLFREIDFDEARYGVPQKRVDWVTGAFLMTRKDIWDRLGGLDESYFMYVEDADYCKRVREAGYRVAYTPEVEIIHMRGGGRTWGGERALIDQMDSYAIYTRKFHGIFQATVLRAVLGAIMAARALAYGALSLLKRSADMRGKRRAFFRAALRLLGIGGGREARRGGV